MTARATAAAVAGVLAFFALAANALGLPPFTTARKTSAGGSGQAEMFAIATGCHATFDRFVIRTRDARAGYDVRYVRRVVADPSGLPVRLRGTKRILVVSHNATAHQLPRTKTPLCPNLRQVKVAGDFEGVVSFGLGLARRTGFRVFRLTGPARIVIDVKH
ncbi:MAG TPA: hypothetical protein VH418_19360 [Solirubrobacteraceae bacterium]|jgi:hypothetical protein